MLLGTGAGIAFFMLQAHRSGDAAVIAGVARIVVDKFRGLYSLNRETVKGSPVVEPSVSVWAPAPLCAMAWPNSPADSGMDSSVVTLMAPACRRAPPC